MFACFWKASVGLSACVCVLYDSCPFSGSATLEAKEKAIAGTAATQGTHWERAHTHTHTHLLWTGFSQQSHARPERICTVPSLIWSRVFFFCWKSCSNFNSLSHRLCQQFSCDSHLRPLQATNKYSRTLSSDCKRPVLVTTCRQERNVIKWLLLSVVQIVCTTESFYQINQFPSIGKILIRFVCACVTLFKINLRNVGSRNGRFRRSTAFFLFIFLKP